MQVAAGPIISCEDEHMQSTVEVLLVRNLHEAFSERDPSRRTAAVKSLFILDCLFCDPRGKHQSDQELESAVSSPVNQFRTTVSTVSSRAESAQDCGS